MKEFDDKLVFREWDTYDLAADAELDKYALDIEAEGQSALMAKWIELLSQAQAELSKAKELLGNEEAKLLLQAKAHGIPDIPKPTDPIAKAWVRTQPSLRKLQRRKRKADNNVAYLQNARSVMEHRKTMIKVEADLWITGFFARPGIRSEVTEEIDKGRKEEHSEHLKKSMEKRHLRTGSDE